MKVSYCSHCRNIIREEQEKSSDGERPENVQPQRVEFDFYLWYVDK